MAKVFDITQLIEVNKICIANRKKMAIIEAELLSQGDKIHEGESARVIVKDGKITLIRKATQQSIIEDLPV